MVDDPGLVPLWEFCNLSAWALPIQDVFPARSPFHSTPRGFGAQLEDAAHHVQEPQ